jgi:hypothetical protein
MRSIETAAAGPAALPKLELAGCWRAALLRRRFSIPRRTATAAAGTAALPKRERAGCLEGGPPKALDTRRRLFVSHDDHRR